VWAETRPEYPPRTHDLLLLVRRLVLTPPKRDLRFLGFIADASVPTRYPEDLQGMVKQYPRRTAASFVDRTRRVIKWLRSQPPLAAT
jgi:HEPN domain-containing protein